MKRMGSLVVAPLAATALLAAAGAATATAAVAAPTAPTAPAAAALPCQASMSNNHPADYTTTDVRVHTVGHASVTTVAHYKTTNHKKTGTAGVRGNATIAYYISGATPGYRVVVSVRVVHGNRSGSCSTWFIPHR
jgi:azurin